MNLKAKIRHFGKNQQLVRCALLVLAFLVCRVGPSPAQPPSQERGIKAGIIYNLTKAIHLPNSAGTPEKEFVIGVLGTDENGPDWNLLKGKTVGDNPIKVVQLENLDDINGIQVLFLAQSGKSEPAAFASGILTISETEGFAERGGIIQLKRHNNKISFIINSTAARKAAITISSQLLKLATIIE